MADRDRNVPTGLRWGSRARLRFAADERLVALVRRGDPAAFEILYDRYAGQLLSFCAYMLGSRADAEDALQSTFASAHTALLADDREIDARPWLFTIARNACLSILRARRAAPQLPGEPPPVEDPVAHAEQREAIRQLLATLAELPERQRAALVLSELHGFSHSEVGALLGVRAEQVKSYVFQARSNLISERDARTADCAAIREELANARGPALLRSRLRRHLRSCPGCRAYAAELSRQRGQLGSLLPVTPSLALRRRALHAALGRGHASAGTGGAAAAAGTTGGSSVGGSALATAAELAGGGKALVVKLLAGVACLGAGSGAATLVVGAPGAPAARLVNSATPRPVARRQAVRAPAASARSLALKAPVALAASPAPRPHVSGVPGGVRHLESLPVPTSAPSQQASSVAPSKNAGSGSAGGATAVLASGKREEPHGRSEEPHGKSEEPRGKSEEPHGKSEEPHGNAEEPHGKSEEPHGKSEQAHGNAEEPHGKSEEAHGKSEEPHANSEEVHGKSEEPHGKGQ